MPDITVRFTAKRDFWCEELQSQYVAGLAYFVTPQNQKLVVDWLADGRIEMGGAASKVTGKG